MDVTGTGKNHLTTPNASVNRLAVSATLHCLTGVRVRCFHLFESRAASNETPPRSACSPFRYLLVQITMAPQPVNARWNCGGTRS